MKQKITSIAFIAITVLASCKKDLTQQDNLQTNSIEPKNEVSTLGTGGGINSPTRTVLSEQISETSPYGPSLPAGYKIKIKIWADYTDGQVNTVSVPVDNDYVLIGGGAMITNSSNNFNGVNALLYASYPVNDGTFKTYVAKSKDHEEVHSHRLWAYAIGMKVYRYFPHPGPNWENGYQYYDADSIKQFLSIVSNTSSTMNHPQIGTGSFAYNLFPLSSGAKLTWGSGSGMLLVSNYFPYAGGIYPIQDGGAIASGKDHIVPTSGNIESSCLLINTTAFYNKIGFHLDVKYNEYGENTNGRHSFSITQSVQSGYLLTGVGARSLYNEYSTPGRLLFAMAPTNGTTAIAASKDHLQSDLSGGLIINTVGIKALD